MLLIQCAVPLAFWVFYTWAAGRCAKTIALFIVVREEEPERMQRPALLAVVISMMVFCLAFVAGLMAQITITTWLALLV